MLTNCLFDPCAAFNRVYRKVKWNNTRLTYTQITIIIMCAISRVNFSLYCMRIDTDAVGVVSVFIRSSLVENKRKSVNHHRLWVNFFSNLSTVLTKWMSSISCRNQNLNYYLSRWIREKSMSNSPLMFKNNERLVYMFDRCMQKRTNSTRTRKLKSHESIWKTKKNEKKIRRRISNEQPIHLRFEWIIKKLFCRLFLEKSRALEQTILPQLKYRTSEND